MTVAISDTSRNNVRSVEKAFLILETLRDAGRSLSLSELSRMTGLDKSAVQRFTRTLRDLGYIHQGAETRRYSLALKVLDLSFSYLNSNELVMRAAPSLVNLRSTTNERIDMSLVEGDALVYVFRVQSKLEPLPAALVGRRVPMFCSAGGRAVLSHLPEEEAHRIVEHSRREPRTPKTLTDPDAIMAEVRRARERGFAIQSEEWRLGEIVVAAAIIGPHKLPVGAVHIVGSTSEWQPDEFGRRMGPLVTVAAQDARG